MSHFIYKIIPLIFLLTITVITGKPIFANHTIDDSIITITQEPPVVRLDSGQVTFTITATRDVFETNQDYSSTVWREGTLKDKCGSLPSVKPDSPQKLVITLRIMGCHAEAGTWNLEVWRGKGTQTRSDSTLIVRKYTFAIEQAGGGIPSIESVRQPPLYGLSETPQVNLFNARAGNTYEFWWDGSHTEFAAKKQATSDGNISNIDLLKNGVDFTKPGNKKLCMEVGNDLTPSITCRYATAFEFTLIPPLPPTGNPSCLIQPPNPVADDSVSVQAINLPNNQEFQAELISGGTVIPLPTKQNSGTGGTVLINIAAHLGIGSYTGVVRDISNQEVCRKEFTIGPKGIGGTQVITDKCDPKDPSYDAKKAAKECTSAGWIPCDLSDPKNPGFQTAIGCIHTSPVGFVKNFLSFAVGISGGLAFLMMLLGAFQMLTSAGNPETLQAGRERFSNAIIGLLIVILAVLLLKIIGADILGIPGFTA